MVVRKKKVSEEGIRLQLNIFFVWLTAGSTCKSITKANHQLFLAICEVCQTSWEVVGLELGLNQKEIKQIKQDTDKNFVRLMSILNSWKNSALKNAGNVSSLLDACERSGFSREAIVKGYEKRSDDDNSPEPKRARIYWYGSLNHHCVLRPSRGLHF